ncbi:MAG: CDP-alcohol phosphatidyltransferase family protein [Lentisphaeria bacterium]
MSQTAFLALIIIGALLVERVGIGWVTASAAGRDWIVRHRLFHPNSISYLRFPMGLVAVGLWMTGAPVAGLLWFAAWMITDLTDGTIARTCQLETESGKWLDPLSDKAMYFPPLLYFASRGVLPATWVVTFICLDTFGQTSRLLVKKKAANSFGKAKTALVTILLFVVALQGLGELSFLGTRLVYLLTVSCTVLAFLSVFCKVIPDVWYANTFSVANLLCGLAAIWQVTMGHPVRAFILVFIGQLFDLFDGRLARKFGSTTHGALFDDVADGTSFGLAIGYLVWRQLGDEMAVTGLLVAILYVVCVIYRLVRFLKPTRPLPPGVFQGLPSPAGAILAGAAALALAPWPEVGLGVVLLSSYLMISNTPYRHFGQRIWPGLPNFGKLLAFVAVLLLANLAVTQHDTTQAFNLVSLLLAVAYVLFGVDLKGWRHGYPAVDPMVRPENGTLSESDGHPSPERQ